jgi:putative flippase GtrA
MDTISMIVIKYITFAAISILVNLIFQYFCFALYSGIGSLYFAMFLGTLAGLVTKYILDKKWIFYHAPKDPKDDARKFIIYSLMGVFTTIIFWGTEMAFFYLLPHANAKYIGALIGLTIGYILKYYLDKTYVFIDTEEGVA